ncbi:putative SAYSvFN domain-containing protein 1-like [Scophthalmus maximus]|uniref:Putative SAYSvFN domain-containing protein 1-like n=1 Tax=Scophthalmus maximus TaxID=52904 RepID=A0A2U9CUC1_SCOMX|nr:putative SAYSvFN domain-containing protein 1-like [Scophthalmus maximus]
MEQKLAEFRARRQAGMVRSKGQDTGPQPGAHAGAAGPETTTTTTTTTTADEPQTENDRAAAHSPHVQERSDWLLDSALGRWLASKQVIVSNLTLLKVLLWLVLLGLFVELEFGLPFFVISLFYWLYEGLRSPAAREPGELSAYSVFNPDCQPLLGSLTAEQLEGEMGYRPLANR